MRNFPIIISKYKHKTVCEINRCDERSYVSIGAEGMPAQFNHLYCNTHMKQIILEGLKFYSEDIDFLNLVKLTICPDENPDNGALTAEIDALKAEIELLKAENNKDDEKIRLAAIIDSQETTIKSLEAKLKKAASLNKKAGGKR